MTAKIKAAILQQLSKLSNLVAEYALLIVAGGMGITAIIISINWNWDYWAEQTIRDGKLFEIKLDRARILQQIALVALGIPALAFAIWRSITAHRQAKASLRQAATAERGELIDRYTTAAGLLDTSHASVRRAGLIALGQLGIDHPDRYYSSSLQLLTGYVRDQTAGTPAVETPDEVDFALTQITLIRRTVPNAARYEKSRTNLEKSIFKSIVLYDLQLDFAFMARIQCVNMQF